MVRLKARAPPLGHPAGKNPVIVAPFATGSHFRPSASSSSTIKRGSSLPGWAATSKDRHLRLLGAVVHAGEPTTAARTELGAKERDSAPSIRPPMLAAVVTTGGIVGSVNVR